MASIATRDSVAPALSVRSMIGRASSLPGPRRSSTTARPRARGGLRTRASPAVFLFHGFHEIVDALVKEKRSNRGRLAKKLTNIFFQTAGLPTA
jgi:hypothetical protein